MSKFTIGRSIRLSAIFYDQDGEQQEADGTVSVTAVDGLGDVVFTGSATKVDTVYSVTLEPILLPTILTVTFSGAFSGITESVNQHHEVLSGLYADVAQIKAFDPEALDTGKFTPEQIRTKIFSAQNLFDDYLNQSYVRRFYRDLLNPSCYGQVQLLNGPEPTIRAVRDATTGADVTGYTFDKNTLILSGISEPVVVSYLAGHQATPEDLVNAFKIYVRDLLLSDRSGIDARTTSITDGGMTVNFVTESLNKPTGLPAVDAVLMRYRKTEVFFG